MSSQHFFVYGTLLVPDITAQVLGRVPRSQPATLPGYLRRCLRGEVYPGAVPDAPSSVAGCIYFDVTPEERQLLDEYEGPAYELTRVTVAFPGGKIEASTYTMRPSCSGLLSSSPWDLATFVERDLPEFLHNICETP